VSESVDLVHYLHEKARSVGTWPTVVNAFTRRDLTVETDRLPALGGVIAEMLRGTKEGDEYLAGLWRGSLFEDLLWEVDVMFAEKETKWRRPGRYRAPSWSWASVEGPVRMEIKREEAWGGMYKTEDVRLVEAKVEPVSERNPYGEVKGGWLKLRTRTCKVVVGEYRNEDSGVNPECWLKKERWEDRRVMERKREVYVVDVEGERKERNDRRRVGTGTLDMPGERDWEVTELWWLKLDDYLRGLLVTRVEGGEANRFVRVGTGDLSDGGEDVVVEVLGIVLM
jgi:hypothetical protein